MRGFTIPALIYLALPTIVFFITWVNPWIGFPCAALVAYCCFELARSFQKESPAGRVRPNAVFVCAVALFWTAISGAGSYFPQFQGEDYMKHVLLFNDLVHRNWPVIYNANGPDKSFLCYSVGYYLVPSLFAKILGEDWIFVSSFLWTFLGIYLFFYWISSFHGKSPIRTLVLFLFFSGFGLVWLMLRKLGLRDELAVLGINFNYPDWWTKFAFSPQHALACAMGTALLYEILWLHGKARGSLFVWSLVILWSPFTPVGLLLLFLLAVPPLGIKSFFEPINILGGGVVVLALGIYYQAHMKLSDSAWIWSHGYSNWFGLYLLYSCFQILVPAGCILLVDSKYDILQKLKPLFIGATLLLILLPLYKLGRYSDLRVQASGPPLVILTLGAVACLTSSHFSLRKWPFLLLVLVYVLGASYPLLRPWYTITHSHHDYSVEGIRQATGETNLSQMRTTAFDYAAQYLGKTDSIAYTYLLRH